MITYIYIYILVCTRGKATDRFRRSKVSFVLGFRLQLLVIFEEDAHRAQHMQEAAYLACSTCSIQHTLRAACSVCTDFRAYTQAAGLPSSFIGPDACAAHAAH